MAFEVINRIDLSLKTPSFYMLLYLELNVAAY